MREDGHLHETLKAGQSMGQSDNKSRGATLPHIRGETYGQWKNWPSGASGGLFDNWGECKTQNMDNTYLDWCSLLLLWISEHSPYSCYNLTCVNECRWCTDGCLFLFRDSTTETSSWPVQSGSHMLPQQCPAGSLHDDWDPWQVWISCFCLYKYKEINSNVKC